MISLPSYPNLKPVRFNKMHIKILDKIAEENQELGEAGMGPMDVDMGGGEVDFGDDMGEVGGLLGPEDLGAGANQGHESTMAFKDVSLLPRDQTVDLSNVRLI